MDEMWLRTKADEDGKVSECCKTHETLQIPFLYTVWWGNNFSIPEQEVVATVFDTLLLKATITVTSFITCLLFFFIISLLFGA